MQTSMHRWSSWLSLAAGALLLGLVACGGGGGLNLSSPGTGGTGQAPTTPVATTYPIQSSGPISGFGSVFVNGVRFDDTNASVQLNGQTSTSAALGLGMTASVSGAVTSTTATVAVATAISSWSIAQGQVASVGVGTLSVAGMAVAVDGATVLAGLSTLTALVTGDTVNVWGVPSKADYSAWTATRLEKSVVSGTSSTNPFSAVVSGTVRTSGSAFVVNAYRAVGGPSLVAGQAVTLLGSLAGTTLTVSVVHALDAAPQAAAGTLIERESSITAVSSTSSFSMGALLVDASAAGITPAGATPTVGARAEVEGVWNGSTLVARTVQYQTSSQLQEVEVVGAVTQFTSLSDFVVRGLHFDASGLTRVSGGTFADIKLGAKLHVQGLNMGSVVKVTELEIGG